MDNWLYFWLILLVATLILEGITVGLTSIWVSGGALAALIVAALHGPVWLQAVVFFAVTFVLLYFTRPWAMKYLNSKRVRSNYEETLGQEVRVLEKVNNRMETGKAIYNGMEWTARALHDDEIFEVDEQAIVAEVVGVKLILRKKDTDIDQSVKTTEDVVTE
jgi:membrane protein implicated in regulation of membrane protease activity